MGARDNTGTQVVAVSRDTVISLLQQGLMLTEIADMHGITPSAISQRFSKDPEYQAAKESGMEAQLDRGLMAIKAAGDDLNLARVREIIQRRTEWRAERDFAHRWGAKTQQTVTHEMGASTLPDTFANALLDGKRVFEGESERVDGGSE